MRRFVLSGLSLAALTSCASNPSGSVTTTTSTVESSSTPHSTSMVEPVVTSTSQSTVSASDTSSVIIYFSNTGNTESVATVLQEMTGSDMIEIEPMIPYTEQDLDYNNDDCRANQEQNDDSARPEIANIMDIDGYTTIYLGFPIWWGTAPRIIQTFLESYDFTGKTIAPFCTSGSSGITSAVNLIRSEVVNATVTDGARISVSQAESQLAQWLTTIGSTE